MSSVIESPRSSDKTDEFRAPFYWSNEERLVSAVYRGLLVASPMIDAFSGWALGIGALGLSVAISNIDSFSRDLTKGAMGAAWCLVLAALLAIAQKAGAASVASVIGSSNRVNEAVNSLGGEALSAMDWDYMDREIRRPLWWPLSVLVDKMSRKGVDNLFSLRYAVRCAQIQALAGGLQLLALLTGLIIFVLRAN